ncbi:MAG: hypothetical protein WED11_01810, partial [Natronospirillum sp.]
MTQRNNWYRWWRTLSIAFCVAVVYGLTAWSATAQHAPDSQWRQIELDDFTIIFESGNEAAAQAVAADLEYYLPAMADTLELEDIWGPFPIVLSSSSHQSNGWVRLP